MDVARAYFGAILAREQVLTLEAATAAARAHVRAAESMVTNGLATKSDALLAAVQAGQVEAQLIGARGNAAIARAQLALMLGQPGDTAFILPDSLPSAAQIRSLLALPAGDSASARLDVTAAQLGIEAAQRDVRRANAAYIPRINGFGRYDWNSPDQLFGGQSSYTVGVMASWTPFAGASEIGGRQAALGRADAARAMAEAAEAKAALEQTRHADPARGGRRPARHRRGRGGAGERGAPHRGEEVRRWPRHRRRTPQRRRGRDPDPARPRPTPVTRPSPPTRRPGRPPAPT